MLTIGQKLLKATKNHNDCGTKFMSITGSVNIVTASGAENFFLPLIIGADAPSQGFTRAANTPFQAKLTTGFFIGQPQISITTAVKPDGTFTFESSLPPSTPTEAVQLSLSLNNTPMYRSETFVIKDTDKPMAVYLYQPNITAGITAGQISKGLANVGLPSNTSLSAKSGLLGVTGSKEGADITFNIAVTVDTSHILTNFVDLALGYYNIHVGFPADCSTSADGVLAQIRNSLQTADSTANQIIVGQIISALGTPPLNVPAQTAEELLKKVSIQFSHLSFPKDLTWPLSNQTDTSIVMVPQVVIGYPRFF